MDTRGRDENLVISYLTLRRLVGLLGMALPIVVIMWGWTISGCTRVQLALWHPVFWLETLALEAFGFSWLVKGETLWRDK